jgi:hypothetical protein
MNKHLLKSFSLIASSAFLVTGCGGDNSSFAKNTSGTSTNNNLISQNNFTILGDPVDPAFFDPATSTFSTVTSTISVQIGDNDNQLITGSRVINFRTEWGLIEPNCTTANGICSVTWRSGSPDTRPADLQNNIIAYSNDGQESFSDLNGNGIFDDGDIFGSSIYLDMQEPFVNVDESFAGGSPSFTTGDIIIDTINGLDLTGANTKHDDGDGLFNGPDCAHSSLCSTTRSTVTVWESFSQTLNGGIFYSVGGTISGITGTLIIQNNLSDDITTSTDGTYSYTILGGASYSITVTAPPGQTCTVSNSTATPTADVTDVDISCT